MVNDYRPNTGADTNPGCEYSQLQKDFLSFVQTYKRDRMRGRALNATDFLDAATEFNRARTQAERDMIWERVLELTARAAAADKTANEYKRRFEAAREKVARLEAAIRAKVEFVDGQWRCGLFV